MNDLEMIRAFAELEGVEIVSHMRSYVRKHQSGDLSICGVQFAEYNPLLPNSLNCAARDKYLVSINHDFKLVCIKNNIKCGVIYQSVDDIPKAVIECILKSEGGFGNDKHTLDD